MPTAESILNYTFTTTFLLLGRLNSFYSTAFYGLTHGADIFISKIEADNEKFYKDGSLAKLYGDPNLAERIYKGHKITKEQSCQRMSDQAKKTLDAACIMYAHGILDAGVYGYLQVLSLSLPDYFGNYIDKKQVLLTDMKSKTYDQLYKEKVQEYVEKTVEYSSLIFKLDKIHEIIQPKKTQITISGPIPIEFKYDRKKLDRFDKLRHHIVHRNYWSSCLIDYENEIRYWHCLNTYLLRLVSEKTGLKLSIKESAKFLL